MANLNPVLTRPLRLPQLFGTNLQTYGALIALVALFLYNLVFTPNFLNPFTININLTQVAPIVIVAVGMTLVIATGGIDLSVGALMAISAALAPYFLSHPLFNVDALGVVLAFVVPILVAGLFGLFNGSLVTFFKIQPIIATLVLFIAGRGFAQVITGGKLQTFSNEAFQFIGKGYIFGIRFQVILMLLIVGVAWWVLRSTTFGRYVLTVGGNERAARLAGVPINRVKLAVYAVSGALAGLAGFIPITLLSSSDPNTVGLNMELDAIAAVAVGGTPLIGGRATIIGTLIGALIIQLIRYTLLSHNVPDPITLIVKAALILLAVYLQRSRA